MDGETERKNEPIKDRKEGSKKKGKKMKLGSTKKTKE